MSHDQGEPSFAIRDAQDRVKKNPDAHESQGLLGELLYQAGRYSEAIGPLEKAAEILHKDVENNPERIGMFSIEMATKILHSLYMMRGDSLLKLNRPGDAKPDFNKALKIVDDDSDTWNFLGVSQANSEEVEEALKSFRMATKLSPGRLDLWENLQKCYKQLRRSEAEEINQVIGNKIDIELNWGLLAELNLSAGDYDETEVIVNQILEWNEDDIRGLLSLARLRILRGSISDSVEVLEKILQIEKENVKALWHLTRVHCQLGNKKESEKSLGTLLKIDPDHLNARALKALLETNTPAAPQTFGVLTVEDYEIGVDSKEESRTEKMTAYKMFPVLTLPLGSTVEDTIHALVRADMNRFTTDKFLKSVNVHTSFGPGGIRTDTNAVVSRGREFRYFEPGVFSIRFMERGFNRGVNPADDKSDLIETGDVVLLSPPMSMQENLQLAAMYPVIKGRTKEKLENWPYRY